MLSEFQFNVREIVNKDQQMNLTVWL